MMRLGSALSNTKRDEQKSISNQGKDEISNQTNVKSGCGPK